MWVGWMVGQLVGRSVVLLIFLSVGQSEGRTEFVQWLVGGFVQSVGQSADQLMG